MKFSNKVKIVIRFGRNQQDMFEIDAARAELRWDANSFEIRGLIKENVIKVNPEKV
jgi:hypothetical protein